jgi:hypothetical protein
MITGIDVNKTFDFVSSYDKSEPKTVWKIGLLRYKDFLSVGEKVKDKPTESLIIAVKLGLKGVENYGYAFSNTDEFIDTIPLNVLGEIGTEIINLSTLSEEETKNS